MSETPKTKLVSSGKSANASKKVTVTDGAPKATPVKKAPAKKATTAKKTTAKKATPALEVVVEAPKGFWARIKSFLLGA
jgi:hypothetical protein